MIDIEKARVDVAVIGGGVVGGLIARELTKSKVSVIILEKNTDVSMGATSANSGIVHAGFDAVEGSLKAKYNVLGNKMMANIACELGVPYKNNGSLVIGFNDGDRKTLQTLVQRGINNGVNGVRLVERDELSFLEPNVSFEATCALYAPTGGIISPYKLCIASIGNAMDNGAMLLANFAVTSMKEEKNCVRIFAEDKREVTASLVINCAGIYSDKIAKMLGDDTFKIGARKGEYMLLDKEQESFVSHTLFTCPSEKGKGALISPTADGNLLLGPTSVETEDKEDNSIGADGFKFIAEHVKKMCRSVPLYSVITSFCGIRAYSDRHDFIIGKSEKCDKLINCAGIESPGLTASPAIAVDIAKLSLNMLSITETNDKFNGKRRSFDYFKNLSIDEKNELIALEPDYGKIICRCEEITLGEIRHAITSNPKATSIDAVKRRTRAGMGRCQGGFCQLSVVDELMRDQNADYNDIYKNSDKSVMFKGKTK